MEDYGFFQSWAAVFCAIIGTITWRIAGVVLASRIPADGPVMGWVNTMAYAMVSAVLLLILVHPTGVLATTGLDHRRNFILHQIKFAAEEGTTIDDHVNLIGTICHGTAHLGQTCF
mgnify:CR=1 FL=1